MPGLHSLLLGNRVSLKHDHQLVMFLLKKIQLLFSQIGGCSLIIRVFIHCVAKRLSELMPLLLDITLFLFGILETLTHEADIRPSFLDITVLQPLLIQIIELSQSLRHFLA